MVWMLGAVGAAGQAVEGDFPGEIRLMTEAELTAVAGAGGVVNVNALVGANRYYQHSTPITGQGTITYNLEAGHIWNGHESLQHLNVSDPQVYVQNASNFGGGAVAPLFDRHATWVGMLIGGRAVAGNPQNYQTGIAPGTALRSAAIASGWVSPAYALSFNITPTTYMNAFSTAIGNGDVINSSFGYTDPSGTDIFTLYSDALTWQNPRATYVTSAGNSGPAVNTVGAPGSGYNVITVGALAYGTGAYTGVASFSSRGPQDFGYYNASNQLVTVSGVRAAVDISAPGSNLWSAYYGGQTGGNNATLTGSTPWTEVANSYSSGIAGTSFAAPIVAGGAALLNSAARNLPGLSGNPDARDSMVIKSLLLTGADKTVGWTNNLQTAWNGPDSYLRTTQSLDWAVGAGRMNLDQTFDIQMGGTRDLSGTGSGLLGQVAGKGWDYGLAMKGVNNDYVFSTPFDGLTEFITTLSWQRFVDTWTDQYGTYVADVAQANLNVSFWSIDLVNDVPVFADLIAESSSSYNTVEHLYFTVPADGYYGLRVSYPENTFDLTTGGVWGTGLNGQSYGLAWSVTAIPEPWAWLPQVVLGMAVLGLRRR